MSGALLVSFVAGALRGHLLEAAGPMVLALPWAALRRLALGLLIDLPAAAATVALCAAAGRVIRLRPWPTPISLVVMVWLLDLLVSALISDELGLWSDPLVVIPRVLIALATVLGGALVLGYRPRRPAPTQDEEPSDSDQPGEEEPTV